MFDVEASWSQAGVGTSFVLKERTDHKKAFKIVFDLGCTPIFDSTIRANTVILSHGHIDHFGGIFSHARAHSMLCSGNVPTYYCPAALVPKLERARDVFYDIDSTCCDDNEEGARAKGHIEMKFIGVTDGEEIELKPSKVRQGVKLYLRPFAVTHGGHPALGYYIISKTTNKSLKEEYKGMDKKKLGELARSGVSIKDETVITRAEVLYSGDTSVDGLMNPDLKMGFSASLILMELTFLDHKDIEIAKERGHMNLANIEPILLAQGWDFSKEEEQSGTNPVREDRKIVFYHVSSRHAPLGRLLKIISASISRILEVAEVDVAVSSFSDPSAVKKNQVNIEPNGCVSLRKFLTTLD